MSPGFWSQLWFLTILIPLVGSGVDGWMNECPTFPTRGGVCKTCHLTCPGILKTNALCLETEKKKVIDDKTIGCVKCFIVYRALSHGFMKSRKKLPENRAVRIKIYLIFKVEKTLEEGGEKSCCHGHGILTQCAPFPTPCCCLL